MKHKIRIPKLGTRLLLAVCTITCFATHSQEVDITSSDRFSQQVIEAGGRVDFVFGDDREFAQSHASTIVQAADGSLLCAWFGGTEEKNPDVGVWMSTFRENTWSKPVRAAKVDNRAHWNPVLFRDETDTLYHFFKVGVDEIQWSTFWSSSVDNGRNWSAAVELVPGDVGGRGPVKNKMIQLRDGTWLAPASLEYKRGKREVWDAFSDWSTDKGKTWTRSENFKVPAGAKESRDRRFRGVGAIQPTFWESKPGKVHALLRTGSGLIWRTDSMDGGRTWSPYSATDLPNNNSGFDALRLEDGRVLLVYNPIGKNWGARTPLDLAVSEDNGHTWRTIAHLEDDPDPDSEYSYPAIVKTEEGVAISYTWNRTSIRSWQIPMELLQAKLPQDREREKISSKPGDSNHGFVFIDAPFDQCHASTIVDTPAGVVAAWFGGTKEGADDVGIWVSRHEGKWTDPIEVANGIQYKGKRYPCWNPVLFQVPNGPLMLFYKVGEHPRNWWGELTMSYDGGRVWTQSRRLPEGIFGPINNKPVLLPDGALVCPSSTEDDGWRVHFEITRDWGISWERTAPVGGAEQFDAIQPAILVHTDGRLQALSRCREDRITSCWSHDGGETWGPMTATDLPNPNSGIDAVTLSDGRHLVVYNHTLRHEGSPKNREMLNVAISDDGNTWRRVLTLENEADSEFSYPAVIQSADGLIHITYTWKRERIKHVMLNPGELED